MWQNIEAAIRTVNTAVNDFVWGLPMIIMILGTGLLLTVRTRVLQVRKFGASLNTTIVPVFRNAKKKGKEEKKDGTKSISQFEAFSTAISGTIGTGNIIGVASAILTGGPGAVFWMWISAFFGMVTNYAENVLGIYYRKRDEEGNLSGGAMYYISEGLHCNWLAYLAAIFCTLAAISMSGVQANKISGTIISATGAADDTAKILTLVIGIAVAIVLALIIIGGIKRIGRVTSVLVPFMSLLFIVMALIIIVINFSNIGSAFGLIFSNIFSAKAAFGGVGGYAFARVIQKGLARGVFSNEAGLGSSVIAHSASDTKEPVKQGLWGVFEVFLDTFVICTLTALVLLTSYSVSDLYTVAADGTMTNAMVDEFASINAFAQLGSFGRIAFSIILPLFAFTTILAWSYYGEKAVEFIFRRSGKRTRKGAVLGFKIIYVALIVVFSIVNGDLVWALSDTFNGLMAIPNLICVVALSGLVCKITKNYFDRRKGLQIDPMLSAYPERNAELVSQMKSNFEYD